MRNVLNLFTAFAILFILICTGRRTERYEPMAEPGAEPVTESETEPIDPAYTIPEEPIVDVTEEKEELDMTIPEFELKESGPTADIGYYNFNKVMYF